MKCTDVDIHKFLKQYNSVKLIMNYKLSKSHYLLGLECPRYLWNINNNPEKIRKETIGEKFTLNEGIKVGEIAKQLFSKGINIPIDEYSENILKTKDFLTKNKPLFEAGFEFENCFARADIIVPNGDGWDIIEVKSSTRVKDKHIHDVSFQKFVYEANGLKIKNCFLLHINREYTRRGDFEIQKFFKKEEITSEVEEAIVGIRDRIDAIFKFISSDEAPEAKLFLPKIIKKGSHNCLTEKCLVLPPNNVFCLYGSKKATYELFESGIELIRDIPESFELIYKQAIQRESVIKGKPYIDTVKLKEFLGELFYPYYFLDFETFSTAIPMFDGLTPYFHVPFQFSLHVVQEEGAESKHFEYLYNGKEDPREEFLRELMKVLGDSGSIIVYHKSFEIGRLRDLAKHFPKHKKWVDTVITRIVDLRDPFRKFFYYHPQQQGSASIKAVLSAMTEMSYEGLEIKDGRTAPVEFLSVTYEDCKESKKQRVRNNLLEYCKLDTLAQVKIVEKLTELVI